MKVVSYQQTHSCAVKIGFSVVIAATREETDELRQALAIVHRYEKAAEDAFKKKVSLRDCDWHMTSFAVKTDCVLAKVEAGACG